MTPLLLSLCDHSGQWSRPYVPDALVLRVDPKHDEGVHQDERGLTEGEFGSGRCFPMADGGYALAMTAGRVARLLREEGPDGLLRRAGVGGDGYVAGIMAAPPCTDFAVSGARHFAAKDADGRTLQSIGIVKECLQVVAEARPAWWVLENPVGRIAALCGMPKWRLLFEPCDYAGWNPDPAQDAYTKKTCLWGDFNPELEKRPIPPVYYTAANGKRSSWVWARLGGKSERTKELRSVTPLGFSLAFHAANGVY